MSTVVIQKLMGANIDEGFIGEESCTKRTSNAHASEGNRSSRWI